MDYELLVGCAFNGHYFYYFYGIIYKMLCGTHTIVESKETSGSKDQWDFEKTDEYFKANGNLV